MGGWQHHENQPGEDDPPGNAARNARLGLVLFAVYLLAYGAFVLIAAFKFEWMAARPNGGVNVAIWSGFGLLAGALVLAFVYSWLCRARDVA